MASENWHLDKRVPIALIVALAIQTGGAIWWAAGITGQVNDNAETIERLYIRTEDQRVASNSQAILLGRIEEQVSALRNDMARLIAALDNSRN